MHAHTHVCKYGYVLLFMAFRGFERKYLTIFDFPGADLAYTLDYLTNSHISFHISFLFSR